MKPHQIISPDDATPGADNTLALADHADHIHVGFHPLFGDERQARQQVDAILKPEQWIKLIDRLSEIDNPVVPTQAVEVRDQGTSRGDRRRPPRRVSGADASSASRSSSSRGRSGRRTAATSCARPAGDEADARARAAHARRPERRRLRAGARAPVEPEPEPTPVPTARATVIEAEPSPPAEAWLAGRRARATAEAALATLAPRGARAPASRGDPHVHEPALAAGAGRAGRLRRRRAGRRRALDPALELPPASDEGRRRRARCSPPGAARRAARRPRARRSRARSWRCALGTTSTTASCARRRCSCVVARRGAGRAARRGAGAGIGGVRRTDRQLAATARPSSRSRTRRWVACCRPTPSETLAKRSAARAALRARAAAQSHPGLEP